ncbi:MAG: GNAT family N-acetyltransferase [Chloroflexota bacterium]
MSDAILLDLPEQLVGERVIVRPMRDEDAEGMFEAVQESVDRIRPWMIWSDQYHQPSDALAYIRRCRGNWVTREDIPLGIFERETGRFLGGTGLHPRNWSVPYFEIGYWVRSSAEGHGFVTDAVKLILRYAFEGLGANRVLIRCNSLNKRSIAIPERLGFVAEGILRNVERDTSGSLADMRFYAMTPADYERADWR